jgi:ketosteroid isomerase-like protein
VSANLDLVRAILAANRRGDYSSTDWADPEIQFVVADGPSPGTWKGLAEMAAGWRDVASAWEDWRTEADEFRELDEERVLVLVHRTARGKRSGLEIGETFSKGAAVFHIRAGKVFRLVTYFDRERGLADLGLESDSTSQRS